MNEWRIPVLLAVLHHAQTLAEQLARVPSDEWTALIADAMVDRVGADRSVRGA